MLTECDVEFRLRQFRQAIGGLVPASKEPEKRNLCLLNVTLLDESELIYYSYSSTASLSTITKQNLKARNFELVPDVPPHLRVYTCGGMGQYHTEPRLVNFFYHSPGLLEHTKSLLIATEIDCCTTCINYTIDAFVRANPNVEVWTDEFGMSPRAKRKPVFQYSGPVQFDGPPVYLPATS